jgi:hypothetical protein
VVDFRLFDLALIQKNLVVTLPVATPAELAFHQSLVFLFLL